MTQQQTLQQRRAAHAWEAVEQVDKKSFKKDYGSLVRSLPAMIQTDGLAHTLAFLNAKGKEHHKSAYNTVSQWVMSQLGKSGNLLEALLEFSTNDYRRATSEALAYLHWLKRFVEAKGWKNENGDK
ncbi:MAG: type III-B CRISPR module-associated protein Cmr5 [Anaerolineae bacterium]|nr:type III-B CRISPR module-associated protein Cmr5 [Anaerolineae bacterium]